MAYKDPAKQREYQRKWANKRHHQNVEVAREKRRLMKLDRIQKINEYKQDKPCADCGEIFPTVAMDFDHLEEKSHGISQMVRGGWAWDRIESEIAKCEIVCANCHRVRTAERGGWL